MILSVGRFSYMKGYGKGFDVLMNAMTSCPKDYTLYIVGDKPTQEFIKLKNEFKLDNLFFIEFKTKDELKEYYKAADIFCLQTRGDVWGLVVNEAMACGLPIITTDRCGAGLELIRDGENGYIVDVEESSAVASKIKYLLSHTNELKQMSFNALETIKSYSTENMALRHIEILRDS